MRSSRLLALALSLLPLACSSGSSDPVAAATPPPGFTFDGSSQVTLGLNLTLTGTPLGFASVQVTTPLTAPTMGEDIEDQVSGAVFYTGVTDVNGMINVTFEVPTEYDMLDLVIHRVGTSGPYTDEGLRTLWGPLAPSSRITVTRAQLASQIIDLM